MKHRFFRRAVRRVLRLKSILLLVIDDKTFVTRQYKRSTGRPLDLENPVGFDEKINWLKLYNRDPLMTVCADKVAVRDYIAHCGLEHILNTVYGVYERVDDIDFDTLPNPCFLKCNHRSGLNRLYDRNVPFDRDEFRYDFKLALKTNYYWSSREWPYKNIKPKIICEKVLRDREGHLPLDYKFFCFGGVPKVLSLDIGVCTADGTHAEEYYRNFYDMDFKLTDLMETRENYPGKIERPENFQKMVEYAGRLSQPFELCRVDLYNIDGQIVFGEITYFHGSGCNEFSPESWDRRLSSWVNLDSDKIVLKRRKK